jgi:hypothetical protein
MSVFSSLVAQQLLIKGYVKDKNSKNGLEYANIMILNHEIGTSTNKTGYYEFLVDSSFVEDTLVFSYMGYKSEYIKISEIVKNNIIMLSRQSFLLEEINIYSNKNEILLNKFKKKQCFLRYSICPFDSSGTVLIPYRTSEPTIEVMFFKYRNEYEGNNKIKQVQIYLSNYKETPSKIRLRIFNSINNKPGSDLLVTPVYITVNNKNQLVTINLEKYNLRLNKEGVYVGCEVLFINENKREYSNFQDKTAVAYFPFVNLVKTDKTGNYWFYSGGRWIMSKYWYFKSGIWIMSDKNNLKEKNLSKPFIVNPAISLLIGG